jgi:hypothetical protein
MRAARPTSRANRASSTTGFTPSIGARAMGCDGRGKARLRALLAAYDARPRRPGHRCPCAAFTAAPSARRIFAFAFTGVAGGVGARACKARTTPKWVIYTCAIVPPQMGVRHGATLLPRRRVMGRAHSHRVQPHSGLPGWRGRLHRVIFTSDPAQILPPAFKLCCAHLIAPSGLMCPATWLHTDLRFVSVSLVCLDGTGARPKGPNMARCRRAEGPVASHTMAREACCFAKRDAARRHVRKKHRTCGLPTPAN